MLCYFYQGIKGDRGAPGSIGLPVSVLFTMHDFPLISLQVSFLRGETVSLLHSFVLCGNLTVVVKEVVFTTLKCRGDVLSAANALKLYDKERLLQRLLFVT